MCVLHSQHVSAEASDISAPKGPRRPWAVASATADLSGLDVSILLQQLLDLCITDILVKW